MLIGIRIAVLALLVVVFGVSIYFRRHAERNGGALDRSQGGGMLVALRLLGLAAVFPLLLWFVNPVWAEWASIDVPMPVRWTAIVAAAALVPAFVWLFRTIGDNISPRETTRSDHALVTQGPYRYVRHPLYTLGFTFFALIALATGLWWLLAWAIVAALALGWRTRQEEANLAARFGDDYVRYARRTGRYLPRFGALAGFRLR